MIDQDKRDAIFLLHEEGMQIKDIARSLRVDRNSVRTIIEEKGTVRQISRSDKIEIDIELLSRLYDECRGRAQRIHEKLIEEEGIRVGYSTLTRIIRDLGLGRRKNSRCARVPDEPGAEMQHDTSPYTITIGGQKSRVVGSILYLRYSKMRYLQFYRSFNRFCMKCFFHEALTYFGYCAPVCIIDNTNLARLRGTGKNAIISSEMERFSERFGFKFVCHEKGHANRKAGNERSFYTVETNFFPGRSFQSLEDLNKQAYEWATVRMANRPVSKSALIPAKAFDYEKLYLVKLPPYISLPYLVHTRDVDQYGYAPFNANFYWVPGTSRGQVLVVQYSKMIKIYRARKLLAEYALPPDGVKNQTFSPKGFPKPLYKPKNRKGANDLEEKKLRVLSEEVNEYLNFALKAKGKEKYKIIRELFGLSRKMSPNIFIKTIKRALRYRITDTECIERIALLQMTGGELDIGSVEIDEQFRDRQAYREGHLSEEVDLSKYEQLLEDDDG